MVRGKRSRGPKDYSDQPVSTEELMTPLDLRYVLDGRDKYHNISKVRARESVEQMIAMSVRRLVHCVLEERRVGTPEDVLRVTGLQNEEEIMHVIRQKIPDEVMSFSDFDNELGHILQCIEKKVDHVVRGQFDQWDETQEVESTDRSVDDVLDERQGNADIDTIRMNEFLSRMVAFNVKRFTSFAIKQRKVYLKENANQFLKRTGHPTKLDLYKTLYVESLEMAQAKLSNPRETYVTVAGAVENIVALHVQERFDEWSKNDPKDPA